MNAEEICELYDSNPNLTLFQLSSMTGKSIEELMEILISERG